MPDLAQWLELYASGNPTVKLRAARALLHRSGETPLATLLDMLDTLFDQGLGSAVSRALQERRDRELPAEMIARLGSPDTFIREAACSVLGRLGDPTATDHLLLMIDDPHIAVQRAAAFALGELKDPAAIPVLERQLSKRKNDDMNVVMALEKALADLGAQKD